MRRRRARPWLALALVALVASPAVAASDVTIRAYERPT